MSMREGFLITCQHWTITVEQKRHWMLAKDRKKATTEGKHPNRCQLSLSGSGMSLFILFKHRINWRELSQECVVHDY